CQLALDRGAKIAKRLFNEKEVERWQRLSETIRQQILKRAWNPELQALTGFFDGDSVDASTLSLPLRRVIPADHPKMKATVAAIERHLDAGNGLLYRYNPKEAPDGLAGEEGAFLLCSFWLVDNLAWQGRIDEAHQLYDSLCKRAN